MGPPWVQQRKTWLKTGANPIHLHLAKRRRIAPFWVHVIPADPPWRETANPALLRCSAAGRANKLGWRTFIYWPKERWVYRRISVEYIKARDFVNLARIMAHQQQETKEVREHEDEFMWIKTTNCCEKPQMYTVMCCMISTKNYITHHPNLGSNLYTS